MRFISRNFLLWVALGLLIPFALGYAIGGTLTAALLALFWGGLVRVFFVHHITWSINSVCHFFGQRRFDTDDRSTNVFWLALPSLGEAWHHNHHAFPRAAVQGLKWWEIDLSGLVIRAMKSVHLAWNVVRITPERQQQRLASGRRSPPRRRARARRSGSPGRSSPGSRRRRARWRSSSTTSRASRRRRPRGPRRRTCRPRPARGRGVLLEVEVPRRRVVLARRWRPRSGSRRRAPGRSAAWCAAHRTCARWWSAAGSCVPCQS